MSLDHAPLTGEFQVGSEAKGNAPILKPGERFKDQRRIAQLLRAAHEQGWGFEVVDDAHLAVARLAKSTPKSVDVDALPSIGDAATVREDGCVIMPWSSYAAIPAVLQHLLSSGWDLELCHAARLRYRAHEVFRVDLVEERIIADLFRRLSDDLSTWDTMLSTEERRRLLTPTHWYTAAGRAFCYRVQEHVPLRSPADRATAAAAGWFEYAPWMKPSDQGIAVDPRRARDLLLEASQCEGHFPLHPPCRLVLAHLNVDEGMMGDPFVGELRTLAQSAQLSHGYLSIDGLTDYAHIPAVLQHCLSAGFSVTLLHWLRLSYQPGETVDPARWEERFVTAFEEHERQAAWLTHHGWSTEESILALFRPVPRDLFLTYGLWHTDAGRAFCRRLQAALPQSHDPVDAALLRRYRVLEHAEIIQRLN